VHVGLNKGQAKNALAKAVFFNRLDEMRDRSFENQRYPASGLNLVVAAIIPWNTVYLERAIRCLKEHGLTSDENLLKHVSPLGWEPSNSREITSGAKTSVLNMVNSDLCLSRSWHRKAFCFSVLV